MPARTDSELLDRYVAAADEAAFAELVSRYGALVNRTCQRVLGNVHDAEEAAQAAFLVLARKARSLRQDGRLNGWLHRVARLAALEALHRRAAREARQAQAGFWQESLRAELSAAEREAVLKQLDAELDGLSAILREAIVLRYLRGFSEKDAAALAGCPLGTMKRRTSDGLARLRARLAKRGLAVSGAALAGVLDVEASAVMPATLVPAILATVKGAAASGAATAAVATNVMLLTKGVMKMLFWTQVKTWTVVGTAVLAASSAVPIGLAIAHAYAPTRTLGAAAFQTPSEVRAVAFSPDSKRLVTACDREFVIWDLERQAVVQTIPGTRRNLFADPVADRLRSLDAHFLASGNGLLSAESRDDISFDTKYRETSFLSLWDLARNECVRRFTVDARLFNEWRSLALTPDERYVFAAFNDCTKPVAPPSFWARWSRGTPAKQVPVVVVWDVQTGKTVKVLERASRPWTGGNQYGIEAMAASTDGRRLATSDRWKGGKGTGPFDRDAPLHLMLWDWQQGQLLHESFLPKGYRCAHLQWTKDDAQLVCFGSHDGRATTYLIAARDGTLVREFAGSGTLAPDGQTLVLYDQGKLRRLALPEGTERDAFAIGQHPYVWGARVSNDGRWFAASLNSQTFLLVDLQARQQVAPDEGLRNRPEWLDYGPDGRLFAYDKRQVTIYDDRSGKPLGELRNGGWFGGSSCLGAQGRLLLGWGKGGGGAELWDSARGTLLGRLDGHRRGPHGSGVCGVYLSPSEAQAATIGEGDGAIKFHDLATRRVLSELQGPTHPFFGPEVQVLNLRWSRQEERVFVADAAGDWFAESDRRQQWLQGPLGLTGAFDPRTGQRRYWFRDEQAQPIEVAESLELCEERDWVLLWVRAKPTSRPGLWKAADGTFVRWLADPGRGARFTADGRSIVGPAAVVDPDTGQVIRVLDNLGADRARGVVSPTCTWLAMADGGRGLRLVDVRTGLDFGHYEVGAMAGGAGSQKDLRWHPAEAQVALSFFQQASVVQVDLFPARAAPPATEPTPQQVAAWSQALAGTEAPARHAAITGLVAAGDGTVSRLEAALLAEDASDRLVLGALFVLEALARQSSAPAKQAIVTLAQRPAGDLRGDLARNTLLRLQACDRVAALRAATAPASR